MYDHTQKITQVRGSFLKYPVGVTGQQTTATSFLLARCFTASRGVGLAAGLHFIPILQQYVVLFSTHCQPIIPQVVFKHPV